MMKGATATNTLVIPVSDATSLLDLISNTAINTLFTQLGTTAWFDLTNPTATTETHCALEGINVAPTCGEQNQARIRIGILMNGENDCCTPDTFVGFGGDDRSSCSSDVAPPAGSLGSCLGNGGTGPSVYDFGYIFVR
jgi:hypothetical protein